MKTFEEIYQKSLKEGLSPLELELNAHDLYDEVKRVLNSCTDGRLIEQYTIVKESLEKVIIALKRVSKIENAI